jgi:hypothetical protein
MAITHGAMSPVMLTGAILSHDLVIGSLTDERRPRVQIVSGLSASLLLETSSGQAFRARSRPD